MENLPQLSGRLTGFNVANILKGLLVFSTGLVLLGWLWFTPPGLLGKADAAGYAVCHRIAARSFVIGDRQAPLCARCSGMYLGALLGIAYLCRFGKRSGMPSLKVSAVLFAFLIGFGLDGANSYLHFFPGAPGLYEPTNMLRLITGTGIGLGLAAILMPVAHQVLWKAYDARPALAGWRQFLPLLGLAGLIDLAVLSENPLLLYPLALLSAASIFVILSIVYMVVWLMVTKKENRLDNYRDLAFPWLAGFLTALLQIAILDAVRYFLTGTWAGFNL